MSVMPPPFPPEDADLSSASHSDSDSEPAANGTSARPYRPTHLGIHLLDETSRVLYVSSGIRQTRGFTPEQLINKSALDFISDGFDSMDYLSMYEANQSPSTTAENDRGDEANAYIVYTNLRGADGAPVYTRVALFPCDSCVLYVCQVYPDALPSQRNELEVQMLDGEKRKRNVTRERGQKIAQARAQPGGRRTPLYSARSNQVKAAFVLEHPVVADIENDETGDRPAGPLVVFVTGSVSRLVDADTSDLMRVPFMQLVAPEDMLHVGKFFDRLSKSTDVLFETFSLLSRPPVVEGDVHVADEDNHRVVVECLGGSSQDGLAILMRKLRTAPAPTRDTMRSYTRSRVHRVDDEGGYLSLSEFISSGPDTSDVPDTWLRLR